MEKQFICDVCLQEIKEITVQQTIAGSYRVVTEHDDRCCIDIDE